MTLSGLAFSQYVYAYAANDGDPKIAQASNVQPWRKEATPRVVPQWAQPIIQQPPKVVLPLQKLRLPPRVVAPAIEYHGGD